MFRRTLMLAVGAFALITALGGCGGGADRTKAQVRLVNASGYAQLDLRVHAELRQGQVGYGGSASYIEVDPSEADMLITRAGSTSALLSFTPPVSKNKHYSVLAFGSEGALKQVLLEEEQGQPATGDTLLRVLNGFSDSSTLDVYITGIDEPLATAVAVQPAAAAGTLGNWITVKSGTLRLRVTGANNKADLRLDVSNFVLGSREVATLALSPTAGGVLVNGLLVVQQSGLARHDVTQARVRAVAGAASAAAVSVQVGGAGVPALLSGVSAPAVGNYVLVPAGVQPVSATVNGAALSLPAVTLTAGADYTMLVHGTPTTPLFDRIDDDNRLPTDMTQARIRLVHGVSGAGDLTLTADATPVGVGIAAGKSTAYELINATTTADLNVSGPQDGVLYREPDRTLLQGATYTVFMLGSKSAPTGVLRRDR